MAEISTASDGDVRAASACWPWNLILYGLVVVGFSLALVGSLVAMGANWPAAGWRESDPHPWVGRFGNGSVAGLALWVVVMMARRAWWTSEPAKAMGAAVASVLAALGYGISAVVVIWLVPEPGLDGGIDASFPVTAAGLGAAAFGATLVSAGYLVAALGGWRLAYDGGRWRRRQLVAGALAAVTALVGGVVWGPVIGWAERANTATTQAHGSGPGFGPPVLDGTVQWSVPAGHLSPEGLASTDLTSAEREVAEALERIHGPREVTGTAGGVAVVEGGGVRMLDPADLQERWSYHRWDHDGPGRDGSLDDFAGTAVSADGELLAVALYRRNDRYLWIDDLFIQARVVVLDARSGEAIADLAIPGDGHLVAVDDRTVFVEVTDRSVSNLRNLAAYDFDGSQRWELDHESVCPPDMVEPVDGDVVVTLSCASTQLYGPTVLLRADGRTGEVRWDWEHHRDSYSKDLSDEGYREHNQQVAAAVAGDVAIIDVRVFYLATERPEHESDRPANVRHNLLALDLEDGRFIWEQRDESFGQLRPGQRPDWYASPLYVAGDVVVLVEQHQAGDEAFAAGIFAIDTADGEVTWSDQLEDSYIYAIALPNLMTVLDDGRFVLLYGDRSGTTAEGRPRHRCLLGAWGPTSGEQQDVFELAVDGEPFECQFAWSNESLKPSLFEVPGGVVAHISNASLTLFS